MVESARASDDEAIGQNISAPDAGMNNNTVEGNDEGEAKPRPLQYTIPAVLHFIQYQWLDSEREKARWEEERAELKARIAALEGEKKGMEGLKLDLIRRIKMLEFALKQEREKSNLLRQGTQQPETESSQPPSINGIIDPAFDPNLQLTPSLGNSLRRGRELLRQYLGEIGYADALFEVRSRQARSFLGLPPDLGDFQPEPPATARSPAGGVPMQNDDRVDGIGKQSNLLANNLPKMADTADDALASFDFLSSEPSDGSDEEEDSQHGLQSKQRRLFSAESNTDHYPMRRRGSMETLTGRAEDLGELADLSISSKKKEKMKDGEESSEKLWSLKYTMRSHFGAVRAAVFLPWDNAVVTASDDGLLKLWNLSRSSTGKKYNDKYHHITDLEPIYAFRGHTGPVLCLAVCANGEYLFSGSLDKTIRKWKIPPLETELYGATTDSDVGTILEGHTDAVWSLVVHPCSPQLASASSDGTVCLWDTEEAALLKRVECEEMTSTPTCLDFVPSPSQPVTLAVGTKSGTTYLIDLETRKKPHVLSPEPSDKDLAVNAVVSHRTLPLLLTGHANNTIHFWDTHSGALQHVMNAHVGAVTSLSFDASGLYILSGSDDCSWRLWDLENRHCVQETTAHHRARDEGVLSVAFHPTETMFVTTGADELAKVYALMPTVAHARNLALES